MTAKEKARDLVSLFYYALPNNGGFTGLNSTTSRYQEGIRCAAIAVDEMMIYSDFHLDFLQEVKQEIEKIEKL